MKDRDLYRYLAREPHVLIGGTTGSGKSTALDGLLFELTAQNTGSLEIYVVDLKKVSLANWKKCKHLKKYATTFDSALNVVEEVSRKMDGYFSILSRSGGTHLDGTHVYLIVDECADLLQTSKSKDVRQKQAKILEKLCHIGRLGRAVNVHLIACTQSPSRATIPAELQVNFTACLGLRCRNPIESRQVVGVKGCELLPRYGQGLLYSADYPNTILVDIPLVPSEELAKRQREASKRNRAVELVRWVATGQRY